MVRVAIVAHEFSPFQGSECAEVGGFRRRLVKVEGISISLYLRHPARNFFKGNMPSILKTFLRKIKAWSILGLFFVEYPAWTLPLLLINRKLFGWMSGIGLPFCMESAIAVGCESVKKY